MSPIALWFTVGAIVALYSLIVDFKWSRKNKITIYKRYCKEGDLPIPATEFYSLYYPLEVTFFTLAGPAAPLWFWGKCRTLTKESRKHSANS
ncbi:hypothetical protein key_116 [Erwinia phage KEY]|uniref:Uncharacterized protein n=2 Tax=Keyvirus TaxID=3152642 RepID=A0AAE7WB15_9CAUD|nr:hypothetical protein AAS21_gp129 [Pantoea phage vB_PagS_AAS21]QYC51607.1 hypothetical protein key_116 [Erwinia phage KEY]